MPQDKVDEIIEWIGQGKTLREWCRQPGNPSFVTVYNWLEKDNDFYLRFTRAREIGADMIAEEAMEIINTMTEGKRVEEDHNGNIKTVKEDALGHRKLQFEGRLKLLAKWFPQKYGDKLDVNHAGGINLVVGTGIPDDTEETR